MSVRIKRREPESGLPEIWTRAPSPEQIAAIRAEAVRLDPRLADADSPRWDTALDRHGNGLGHALDGAGDEYAATINFRRARHGEHAFEILAALGVPDRYLGGIVPTMPPRMTPTETLPEPI